MAAHRIARALLFIGVALIIVALFVPWYTLTTSALEGLPPIQTTSPLSVILSAVSSTPGIVGFSGTDLLAATLVHIVVAVVSGGSSLVLSFSRKYADRATYMSIFVVALLGAIICGLYGMGAALLSIPLSFGNLYDVSIALGIPLDILGSILVILGISNLP